MDIPKYIYHYTSIEVFLDMLKSHILWLTDISMMNDKNEMFEMLNALEKDLIKSGMDAQRTKELFKHVKTEYPQIVYLATCFSALRDDAAMWERYADKGRGVCIKFDAEKLNFYIHREEFNCKYNLDYICYSRNERYEWILEDIKKEISRLSDKNWDFAIRGNLPLYIQRYAILYKNKSFESECEIRLHTSKNIIDSRAEYFSEVNGIVKCVDKLKIPLDEIFSEVILGPRTLQNIDIFRFYVRALNHLGISHNINKSECSLR